MNVVDLESYSPKRGYMCFNACIVNCLSMSDIQLTSSDVFFAGNAEKDMFLEEYRITHEKHYLIDQDIKSFFCEEAMRDNSHLIINVRPDLLDYSSVLAENIMGFQHSINIVGANDEGVNFIDGYAYTVMGEVYSGFISYEKLKPAWDIEGNVYHKIFMPEALDENKIKEDAKRQFYIWLKRNHKMIDNSQDEIPVDDILFYFWTLKNKIEREQCINMEYMNTLLAKVKVSGFLIGKNMVWEKISEYAPSYADDYLRIIHRWNHILLVMRKYSFSNKVEKVIALYNDIVKVVLEEDQLLMKILQTEL